MSDTPRTDLYRNRASVGRYVLSNEDKAIDFARTLERENNALREEIEVLRSYGNKDCTGMADVELERRRKVVTP